MCVLMFVYNIFLIPFTLDCDLLVYSEDIIHKVYIVTYFSPMKKMNQDAWLSFPKKWLHFREFVNPVLRIFIFFIVYIYDLFYNP